MSLPVRGPAGWAWLAVAVSVGTIRFAGCQMGPPDREPARSSEQQVKQSPTDDQAREDDSQAAGSADRSSSADPGIEVVAPPGVHVERITAEQAASATRSMRANSPPPAAPAEGTPADDVPSKVTVVRAKARVSADREDSDASRRETEVVRRPSYSVSSTSLAWAGDRPPSEGDLGDKLVGKATAATRQMNPPASAQQPEQVQRPPTPQPAPGKRPSQPAPGQQQPADAQESGCGSGSGASVPIEPDQSLDPEAQPRFAVDQETAEVEPVWQGKPAVFPFVLRNTGGSDLKVKIKGG